MAYTKNTLKSDIGRWEAPSSPTQTELRRIESMYRSALSGAVVAKARYLALNECSPTPTAVARAHSRWKQLDASCRILAMRRSQLEAFERAVATVWRNNPLAAAEFQLTLAPGRIS